MSLTRSNVLHAAIRGSNVSADGVLMVKVKNRAKICALFISVATASLSGCNGFQLAQPVLKIKDCSDVVMQLVGFPATGNVFNTGDLSLTVTTNAKTGLATCSVSASLADYIGYSRRAK